MPPKRDNSDSDTSDSGPEEEVKKPAPKKAKASSDASESSLRVEDAEDPTWQLDKMRRVCVREFKGKAYVDIREFYEKDGKTLPGKKGISITPQQFQKLKSIIPDIEKALKEI